MPEVPQGRQSCNCPDEYIVPAQRVSVDTRAQSMVFFVSGVVFLMVAAGKQSIKI
jgi:hypothetical protein